MEPFRMKSPGINVRFSLHWISLHLFCFFAGSSAEYTSFDDKLEQFQNQMKTNRLQYETIIKHLKDLQPEAEHKTKILAVEKMTEDLINSSNQVDKSILELKEHRTLKEEIEHKIKLYDQTNKYKACMEELIKKISEVDMTDMNAKQKMESLFRKYFESIFPDNQWSNLNLRFFVAALFNQFGTMDQLKATSDKWIGTLLQQFAEHPEFFERIKKSVSDMKGVHPMLNNFDVDNLTQVEAVARMLLAQMFLQFPTTDDLEKWVSETIDHYSQEYIGAKVMHMNLKSIFDTYYMLLTFIGKQQWQDILAQINSFNASFRGGQEKLKNEIKETKAQIKKLKEKLVFTIDEKLTKMDSDLNLANSFEVSTTDGNEKSEL